MSQEITEYLLAAAIFIAISGFFTWKSLRLKRSSWSGIVESVTFKESRYAVSNEEDGSYAGQVRSPMNDKYLVTLRLENGSRKKVELPVVAAPSGLSQGDKIEKIAGSYEYRINRN